MAEDTFEPKIVGFLCNWCSYAGADLAGTSRVRYPQNLRIIRVPCSGRVDPLFVQRCKENGARETASVIVAGLSYGQGSSREHAALCPAYLGVRAVIAKSIERIHAANLVNFGILPLTFTDQRDYEDIEVGDELFIADTRSALNQTVITVKNRTRGQEFTVSHSLTPRQIAIIQGAGR